MKRFVLVIFLLAVISVTGCAAIGPKTISRDRFDYTSAISDSWKNQMLYNLVKIRYGDAPVFLEVASVINQYEVENEVNANFLWSFPPKGNSQGVGGIARYIDRPTITYTPLSGDKFARSLMTPIPPAAILSLLQAGYPVDLVLRLCIHSINGIQNRYGGQARARNADPEFYPLLEKMRRIQEAGGIGMRVKKIDKEEAVVMFFHQKVDQKIADDILANRQMLGLDPQSQEYRVVYGSIPKDDKEVAILTRSVIEIFTDLASYIEVPDVHVTENRVNRTMADQSVSDIPVKPLMQIHSSHEKPADAFVAVPYRDYWFWIDDRDVPSKRMFSFLMFVFTLVETGGKEGAPVITIPAG